uniref:E146L homolog protein n=1 Tax=Abalone asfa-like virus TaxID=2839893 RepID=A0A5K7XYM0_9VIRU|nr:E146L homolog protein [Abalone asfa-like virus]BCY04611.1 hypothetical protein [Abalone asfa-like virus]
MDTKLILTSVIIASVVILILILIWYRYTGWKAFIIKQDELFSERFQSPKIRFKNAIFTLPDNLPNNSSGPKTKDVTKNLNAMVNEKGIQLVDPLNPFSFTIYGTNSSDVVSNPRNWANTPARLEGQFKIL